MGTLRVTTTLQPRGPAAAIVLTDEEVLVVTGGPKVAPVKVTIGGHSFDGRIARMGGENLIGLNKAVRAAAGVEAGEAVDVEVVLDTAERRVPVPDDLAAALAAAGVAERFDALAPSRRKELVRRVEEAKRAETRAKRVAEAVATVSR